MMSRLFQIARSEGDPKIVATGRSSLRREDVLARQLGWFSIGLGLAELFGARRLGRALGLERDENLIRAFGVREIASGVMSLSIDKHVGLWSRVAGDALDVAVLAKGLSRSNPKQGNVEVALGMVAAVGLLDIAAATLVSRRRARHRRGVRYDDRSGFPGGVAAARRALGRSDQVPLPSAAPARV